MSEAEYGIITQAKPQFPVRELLVVPQKNWRLTLSFPAFGPSTYRNNLEKMKETYSHPVTGEQMTFRPAQISESISAVAYDFEHMAKPKIFDPRWLQAGYIVRTQDGVFTNTTETDNIKLKQLLNRAEKVNGIYLIPSGIAFAPYETFETGVQDVDTFTQGGLARALEHTPEKTAVKLREIGSPKHYKRRINIWGFDPTGEPVQRIASLDSYRGVDGRLGVGGDCRGDFNYGGFAFGVSK